MVYLLPTIAVAGVLWAAAVSWAAASFLSFRSRRKTSLNSLIASVSFALQHAGLVELLLGRDLLKNVRMSALDPGEEAVFEGPQVGHFDVIQQPV